LSSSSRMVSFFSPFSDPSKKLSWSKKFSLSRLSAQQNCSNIQGPPFVSFYEGFFFRIHGPGYYLLTAFCLFMNPWPPFLSGPFRRATPTFLLLPNVKWRPLLTFFYSLETFLFPDFCELPLFFLSVRCFLFFLWVFF